MLVVFVTAAGVSLEHLLLEEHHRDEADQDQSSAGLLVFFYRLGQDMDQDNGQKDASRKGRTEVREGASGRKCCAKPPALVFAL